MSNVTILNDNLKLEIVDRFNSTGVTKAQLAREYGVSSRTIGRVIDSANKGQSVDEVQATEESERRYKFVCTPTTIVISAESETESESASITIEDDRFNGIFELIVSQQFSQDSLEEAFLKMSKKTLIENLTFGNIQVDIEAGEMVYTFPGSGETVSFVPSLATRVISAVKQGTESDDFVGLINFVERLAWNPDPQVVSNLYDFLLAKDIQINRDGFVVCYKKINERFFDIYTNTIDNSVGKHVRVKRDYVDDNPNNTCSQGLHVCSWSYLRHYGSDSSNVVVEVHVDPKDFVSIPFDYYQTYEGDQVPAKARVCEYMVVKQVDYTEPTRYFDESDWDYDEEDDESDYL